MNNRALVFIKPHAVTDAFISYTERFLVDSGVRLSQPVRTGSDEVSRRKIIDRHYFAIAATAVFSTPDEYVLGNTAKENFRNAFGISWQEALEKGKILNSVDTQKHLGGISGIELNEHWQAAQQVKMAPGLYAGHFAGQDIFCINGFYPGQREVFTSPGAEVVLYEAEFSPGDLSWRQFRQEVIGATDPSKAAKGSLRSELLERFVELGLTARPVMSKNGIHASAGPLEGLRERMVWLDSDPDDDPFAQALMQSGLGREKLDELLENPVVSIGSETGPVFDLTEDMDSAEAVDQLHRLHS